MKRHDSARVAALVVNRGRSWIETEEASEALALFQKIESTFEPGSVEVVWSQYLAAIAVLFRDRAAPPSAFDQSILDRAEPLGLRPLILAERMEFARKRNDPMTLEMMAELQAEITPVKVATDQQHSYALGVAFFLIGNLQRAAGRYDRARESIARARSFFRPAILSHQVEIAHCYYASAVCRAMTGGNYAEEVSAIPFGAEFHRFADALGTLTRSHSAWATNRLGDAIEHAERASLVFQQIRFGAYGVRAKTLCALLGAWRRLELGASPDEVFTHLGQERRRLLGMLGNPSEIEVLKGWISHARPSRVIGLLQFASAYNPDWTRNIGPFQLPPILQENSEASPYLEQATCSSLAEADASLRSTMRIAHDARLPLLAD